MDDLYSLLNFVSPSIIALTETWLTHDNESMISLNGYTFIHSARGHGRGGGVGFFARNELNVTISTQPETIVISSFEFLTARVHLAGYSFSICVIYRPPSTSISSFNEELERLLSVVSCGCSKLLVMGDFNINHLPSQVNPEFIRILASFYLFPSISIATRHTATCESLLDNIFTNFPESVHKSIAITSDISDHLPVYIDVSLNQLNNKIKTFSKPQFVKRLYHKTCIKHFIDDLDAQAWTDVIMALERDDVDDAYLCFITTYITIYEDNFPAINCSKSRHSKFKKEWMTEELHQLTMTKSKLHKNFIKNKSEANRIKFVNFRNNYKRVKLKTIANHYCNKLWINSSDPHKLWGLSTNSREGIKTNLFQLP